MPHTFKVHVPERHHDKLRAAIEDGKVPSTTLDDSTNTGTVTGPEGVLTFELIGDHLHFTNPNPTADQSALEAKVQAEVAEILAVLDAPESK